VARQSIGNGGKIDHGMVSVNAYGVVDQLTFPRLFKVFKPEKRLKAQDRYQTKPQLAVDLVRAVRQAGLRIELVLADSLYGESSAFVETLLEQNLPLVVAIGDNHGVWLGPDQHIRYTRWRPCARTFSDGSQEQRYLREIIFGQRDSIRYYPLTTDPVRLPEATTCLLMTARKPAASHRALARVVRRGFSFSASAEVAPLYRKVWYNEDYEEKDEFHPIRTSQAVVGSVGCQEWDQPNRRVGTAYPREG
jgi:SRSO17 transposase